MDSNDELSKFVVLCLWLVVITTSIDAQVIKPECQQMCGDVPIPYPFGTTEGCYMNTNYLVTCNSSKLFWENSNIQIQNITLDGELRVLLFVARDCYTETGQRNASVASVTLPRFPFSTRNKFVAIGCDTYAIFNGYQSDQNVTMGCLSVCQNKVSVTNDGSCSGVGCCQTAIPKGMLNYTINVGSFSNHSGIWDFNPCSYSFLAEENSFNFSIDYLSHFNETRYPVALEWAIGDQRCADAERSSSYTCSRSNSTCFDTDNGPGYRCNCSQGYQGNPYVPDGCIDIDECKDPKLSGDCQEKYCTNTPGSFNCKCPKGYRGDGRKLGCVKKRSNLSIFITIGVAIGVVALAMCGYSMHLVYKQKKLVELKHKFFQQNGGLMLQQQLTSQEGYSETAKIFSMEELEKATNKYDESRVIGRGGYGTVYKGILAPDHKVVAVKKSKLVDKRQIEQFINEVVVLTQVNHRNIVKLLGCCLETEVPLLVYEFVSKGTLFEHIHEQLSPMSWDIRLRIGAETAGVLAYLHSSASIPIIHGDVTSTNILLDENYVAKVSGFGASRLVPHDQTELSTELQGTLGYLDSEYLQTGQLTEKRDVYGFGVVLVELLTGRKPLSNNMPENERSLANFFLASLKSDRLFQILGDDVSKEANPEQVQEFANLAKRCLRMKGKERPTMKEVAMKLEGIRVMGKHEHSLAHGDTHLEETESLSSDTGGSCSYSLGNDNSANNSLVYDSTNNHLIIAAEDER